VLQESNVRFMSVRLPFRSTLGLRLVSV
jgi:hypothetical protein